MSATSQIDARPARPWFVTTHWTVVLSAREPDSTAAAAALEQLCRTYWYPLYVYVRRQGHAPHDAQDLTQEFFARLLAKDYLKTVAREKGRFRTFLLVAMKRFLANEWDRVRAQKRGAGQVLLPLDTATAETRYQGEPAVALAADSVYDRRWALTLLDATLGRLREEFTAAGKAAEFEQLKAFLTAGPAGVDQSGIAVALGVSEGALRVAVHRLRRRFREIFREIIAHTVARPEDIDAEVWHLITALSAPETPAGG